MNDRLVAYALNGLEPAERAAVEAHLARHPADADLLARLRCALAPLEADRDGYDPPPGLAAAAIARTAEHVVAHRLIDLPAGTTEQPTPSSLRAAGIEPIFPGSGWRRADLAVAACIGFLAVGLLVSGVGKVRQESQVRGCQNNLRELHAALVSYSSHHGGRFPKVGSDEVPVAGAFADELARTGHLPPGGLAPCPASSSPEPPARFTPITAIGSPVGYAYTLGFRMPGGQVTGVRRADGLASDHDWVPVSADLPVLAGFPHSRGLNVLYAGGTVRFSTTPAAGINGDNIYHNAAGLVRAGLYPDATLGSPPDVP